MAENGFPQIDNMRNNLICQLNLKQYGIKSGPVLGETGVRCALLHKARAGPAWQIIVKMNLRPVSPVSPAREGRRSGLRRWRTRFIELACAFIADACRCLLARPPLRTAALMTRGYGKCTWKKCHKEPLWRLAVHCSRAFRLGPPTPHGWRRDRQLAPHRVALSLRRVDGWTRDVLGATTFVLGLTLSRAHSGFAPLCVPVPIPLPCGPPARPPPRPLGRSGFDGAAAAAMEHARRRMHSCTLCIWC
jgi:hypothetical protein